MMSNETFAILTPIAILAAMAGGGGLLFLDIVRRHPARAKVNSERGNREEKAPAGDRETQAKLTKVSLVEEVDKLAVHLQGFAKTMRRLP